LSNGSFGESYAIDTTTFGKKFNENAGIDELNPLYIDLRNQIDTFIKFAKDNPKKTFFVAEIGIGIAIIPNEIIGPLFVDAIEIKNICLPKSYFKICYETKTEQLKEKSIACHEEKKQNYLNRKYLFDSKNTLTYREMKVGKFLHKNYIVFTHSKNHSDEVVYRTDIYDRKNEKIIEKKIRNNSVYTRVCLEKLTATLNGFNDKANQEIQKNLLDEIHEMNINDTNIKYSIEKLQKINYLESKCVATHSMKALKKYKEKISKLDKKVSKIIEEETQKTFSFP
jgi:hypothetical protein